jgi:formate transporter
MASGKVNLIKSIMSGILVGIGGIVYVSSSDKVIGAILFSFALILIVSKEYNLFTGKVGYLLPYEKGQAKSLSITLGGNLLGVVFVSSLFLMSGKSNILAQAEMLTRYKLNQLWYETLVLAIFCGFMMYLAVDSYRKIKNQGAALLVVIFAVVIFIIAGFEHSIADMVYITLSKSFTFEALIFIVIVIIGNTIGAVILNLLQHLIKSA